MKPPEVRPAAEHDAAAIASLVTQLGYPSDAAQVLARLRRLAGNADIRALVAERDGRVLGMIGIMVFPAFHRDGLHGYVTALVVDEGVRGGGGGLVRGARRSQGESHHRTAPRAGPRLLRAPGLRVQRPALREEPHRGDRIEI